MTVPAVRMVSEEETAGEVPVWRHPGWQERFPWLLQGTTGRGSADASFDLGLFGEQPVGRAMDRWARLLGWSEMSRAVHSRQVHSAELQVHGAGPESGLLVGKGHDGHLTRQPGVLLTVSVADCIPVFLVDADARAIALVHAGWRGLAAGIVEAAIVRLVRWNPRAGADLWVHCGPSICGRCYEVGPEVHAAVQPARPPPAAPAPIDLAAALHERVTRAGVRQERVSLSERCTLCAADQFFSHRGGSAGRQVGLLGIRL